MTKQELINMCDATFRDEGTDEHNLKGPTKADDARAFFHELIQWVTTVQAAAPLTIGTSHTNVTVNGGNNGTASVTGFGGSGLYNYQLDNSAWTAAQSGTYIFTGLFAGNKVARVRDANDIAAVVAKPITIGEPAIVQPTPLGLTLTPSHVTTHGGSNGSLTAAGSGGTAPYTYSKDGVNYQASGQFAGLSAGPYNISVKDSAGNVVTKSVTLTEPAAPVIAYYGWKADNSPLTLAQIQAGTPVSIASGADITADYRANTQPMFLWMWEPSGQPTKTKWYGSVNNNGNIGSEDDLFGAPQAISGGEFYITNYMTQNTDTTIQFRKA